MLLPGAHFPQVETTFWDKAVHFFCYAVLTFLLLKGFYKSPQVKNYFFLTAVISIGYGIILELLQGAVPDRGVDVLDITANTLGCIASLIIFRYINK